MYDLWKNPEGENITNTGRILQADLANHGKPAHQNSSDQQHFQMDNIAESRLLLQTTVRSLIKSKINLLKEEIKRFPTRAVFFFIIKKKKAHK